MSEKLLLTIAIPTYNRSEILNNTLKAYIEDPDFNEQVEIIISDNLSTDNTEEIAIHYANNYSNIKYYKNVENIKAKNYVAALSRGNGEYLKLMNDNCVFKKGGLKFILDKINENILNKSPIFFYNNNQFFKNCIKQGSSINDFVLTTSYWITTNNNFGIWRYDFVRMEDKDRYAEVHWTQVDMSLRQICNCEKFNICFTDFHIAQDVSNKPYQLFQLFAIEYLAIYKNYVLSRKLDVINFKIEKYRLFRHFLLYWYNDIVINKNVSVKFEREKSFEILKKRYNKEIYFYVGILFLYVKKILKNKC